VCLYARAVCARVRVCACVCVRLCVAVGSWGLLGVDSASVFCWEVPARTRVRMCVLYLFPHVHGLVDVSFAPVFPRVCAPATNEPTPQACVVGCGPV
jgi:hypothetical protein